MAKTFGIGVIGAGWMGLAHARAHVQTQAIFPDFNVSGKAVICADSNEQSLADAKNRIGFKYGTQDWQEVVAHPEVDIVCIASPNYLHHDMIVAAAKAGKHVMCEKPVGRTPADTIAAAKAVAAAGVGSAVGYNYRWTPVISHARELIKAGDLGDVQVYNGRFFSSYGSDPLGLYSWRYSYDLSGTGAINDLLVHVIDLAHWVNSPITRLNAYRHTFIPERHLPSKTASHYELASKDAPSEKVTNEDYVSLMVEFKNGSRGVFDAARSVFGPKADLKFEVYGDKGSVIWTLEKMNEIEIYLKDKMDGYTRVQTSTKHPYHTRFNPGEAIPVGYLDLKLIEAAYFQKSIAENKPFEPNMADAVRVAEVANAIDASFQSGGWAEVKSAGV